MKRTIAAILTVALLTTSMALARRRQAAVTTAPRFEFINVFVDPRGSSLAAYQFELSVDQNAATIVGVEGGEHVAFNPAPHYDPAALSHGRIIIAAFNTTPDLPNGKTRVARLHLRVTSASPDYKLTLQTAADASGRKLDSAIISFDGKGPTP